MLQQLLISLVSGVSSSKGKCSADRFSTPGNEVQRLLLEVQLGLSVVAGGGSYKIQAGLGKVDRAWSRGGTDEVKSRLSVVDRGGSWGGGDEVEGRLGKVGGGGSGSWSDKVQSGLSLPLATTVAGNKGCLPTLGRTDEVLLPVVLTVVVGLPALRGADKVLLPAGGLPLLTTSTSGHDSLLRGDPVQLRLSPVSDNSGHLGAG